MTTLCNCMICQMQEDADNAGQWKATFEKTVAAYQRNLDQHPTGLLADFYMYDESHKVYNAATGRVHEKDPMGRTGLMHAGMLITLCLQECPTADLVIEPQQQLPQQTSYRGSTCQVKV